MKKSTLIIMMILLLPIIIGAVYWYMFIYNQENKIPDITNLPGTTGGFIPLNTSGNLNNSTTTFVGTTTNTSILYSNATSTSQDSPVPTLRLLSGSPIGGYGASTTASTTIVRWIDRGRGNILEARGDNIEINTLSNTFLPKIYESVWNKNITSFIGSMLKNDLNTSSVLYAKLNIQSATTSAEATSTTANIAPYSLKGKNLPENIIDYASSPKGDKIFMLIKENGQSVGYVANFDGTSVSKIFVNPITQVLVEWPEETTIAITTKASSSHNGFLYFVNPKTGIWKKIIGPIPGLSTKVSRDAKYVLISRVGTEQDIITEIYTVGTTTPTSTVFKTLADKCVWGNYYKELVYCAAPTQPEQANYPDDWYKGTITFRDKIWQLNVKNNDVRLVSSLYDSSIEFINAFNLGLDLKDDFLFFMNKNDLSFWSLNLNAR